MQEKSKQALIEHIKNNSLTEAEKEYLIQLLNKNDVEVFLKHFLSICKIGGDLIKLFDLDIGDFNLH